MKLLTLAIRVSVVLLCIGAPIHRPAARADEIYNMRKAYALCKSLDAQQSVTMTFTAFSADGARAAVATGGRIVHVCETATGTDIASLAVPSSLGQDDDIHLVAFSPDGTRLATASRERTVRVWDLAASRELATLPLQSPVVSAVFSPDGTHLVTSSREDIVRVWDAASGREVAKLEHPSPVLSTVFSPDGARLVTTCWEGTAHIWDAAAGRPIATLQGHGEKTRKARFSPDGARIVTASEDATARVWDAASGRELLVLKHPAKVLSAAFSANGARVVTGAGDEAHVFDAASGRETAVLKGHEGEVLDAVFSPDGARIATVSEDQDVRVWDAASGGEIAVLKGHFIAVNSAAFSPDGQRIFSTGGAEGIVWTKLAAASLPEGVAGVWFGDFGPPDEPPEIKRERCMRSPIKIDGDGLIVFFEVGSTEPPQPTLHMRCASEQACQIFAGAPGQGLDAQGTGTLTVSDDAGNLCMAGECRPIARCPSVVWTEEERKSGFAERWETALGVP